MKRIALAMLMALPSAAQDVEQVTVYGRSLNGFRHVRGPRWLHEDNDHKFAAFQRG